MDEKKWPEGLTDFKDRPDSFVDAFTDEAIVNKEIDELAQEGFTLTRNQMHHEGK
jgi:hypothetical protein